MVPVFPLLAWLEYGRERRHAWKKMGMRGGRWGWGSDFVYDLSTPVFAI